MKVEDEERIAANLSRIMAMICVRNTRLEDLLAVVRPVTLTGDYSDVSVVDGTGQIIPWCKVSHIVRVPDGRDRCQMRGKRRSHNALASTGR